MDKNKITQKIQNLFALASNNPSEEEAKAALLKAQELMYKYHVENPETIDKDRVKISYFDITDREMTEFDLLLSVLIAENFRTKTVHFKQRIYFIGFEADANAALEAYTYIRSFGYSSHKRFFASKNYTHQDDVNWKYGFVVGLKIAFSTRKGYELMLKVPDSVLTIYNAIDREKENKYITNDRVKSLEGAFTDGFRRGRESFAHKEIPAVV